MRLRMIASIAGRDFNIAAGEETERFSGEEAARLVRAGYAELVLQQPERAVQAVSGMETRKRKARPHVVSG